MRALPRSHWSSSSRRLGLGKRTVSSFPLSGGGARDAENEENRRREDVHLVLSRGFHMTPRKENQVVLAAAAVGAVAYGGKMVAESLASRQEKSKEENSGEGEGEDEAASSSGGGFFSSFFAMSHYEGGFEDKMTRREAALILGIRESADRQKVREAHRSVLRLNHPDMGGSTYMASKINEAKEMLMGQASED